jgi:hypothetical protein
VAAMCAACGASGGILVVVYIALIVFYTAADWQIVAKAGQAGCGRMSHSRSLMGTEPMFGGGMRPD